jgi:hypothetical protein
VSDEGFATSISATLLGKFSRIFPPQSHLKSLFSNILSYLGTWGEPGGT